MIETKFKLGDTVKIIKRKNGNETGQTPECYEENGFVGELGIVKDIDAPDSHEIYSLDNSKYYGCFGNDDLELISEKPLFNFIVDKWYSFNWDWESKTNGKTIIKVKNVTSKHVISKNRIYAYRNPFDCNFNYDDSYYFKDMSDIKELSIEEVQQYLPDDHPDKIKSLVGRYIKALVDAPNIGKVLKDEIGLIIFDEPNKSLQVDFPSQKGYFCTKSFIGTKYEIMPEGYTPISTTSESKFITLNDSHIGKFVSLKYNDRFYDKVLVSKENGNIYLKNNCWSNNNGHSGKSIFKYSLMYDSFYTLNYNCSEITLLDIQDDVTTLKPIQTSLKKENLIEGEIYVYDGTCVSTYPNGPMLSPRDKYFNYTNNWLWTLDIQHATLEEKEWLKACIKADKFVPKEEVNSMKSEEWIPEEGDFIVYNEQVVVKVTNVREDKYHGYWITHTYAEFSGGGFRWNPYKHKIRKARLDEISLFCHGSSQKSYVPGHRHSGESSKPSKDYLNPKSLLQSVKTLSINN